MNEILKLFLTISLLITCFTVNAIAEDNNASEVQLQPENGELEVSLTPDSEPQLLSEENTNETLVSYSMVLLMRCDDKTPQKCLNYGSF